MASITSQPAPRRRSFGDFLRAAAEGFFQLCAKAAEAYDSLPLENKHRIKRLLVKSLPKPRPDFETQALFGDELELAKLLSEHGW